MSIMHRFSLPRFLCVSVVFIATLFISLWMMWRADTGTPQAFTNGELMTRLFVIPAAFAGIALIFANAWTANSAKAAAVPPESPVPKTAKPFMAQVVGLQWLNPLQRKDYPTEWQLLWTMGFVQPNPNDDMVKLKPEKYGKLGPVLAIAYGNKGDETFDGFHEKYLDKLIQPYRDKYFSDSRYFYNAHSVKDKKTWRELAGIHVEYALPAGRLDPVQAASATSKMIMDAFDIGLKSFPNAWSRDTPPDVRITMGGPNAGFTSLAAGLDYLQAHPNETVWVMNWDAPNFPPNDRQLNENIVQLILAGPDYKTERAPLAWLSYPASSKVADFESKKGLPPRVAQAWNATLERAAQQAGKQPEEIGFVVHDAGKGHAKASDRLAHLARSVAEQAPELDFMKQTFNTPGLLGDMGAGTALTNVALGIAYANHFGKNVLVAGTTDADQPTATLVVPPAVVRPIDPNKPWFRARGENSAYLAWWGLRHDARESSQGYSQ